MAKTNDFRALAQRYFEGTIKAGEESRLHSYILKHPDTFRTWESEWNNLSQTSSKFESEWLSLKNQLTNVKPRRRTLWQWAPSLLGAAALTIALIISFSPRSANDMEYRVDVPLGSKSKLTLADGSTVWLNAGSKLTYTPQFGSKHRTVNLDGEAYFEVAKDESLPFLIHTSSYDVRVTGTRFNLSAYSEDEFCTTSLMEGSVDILYSEQEIKMSEGKSLRLDKNTGKISFKELESYGDKAWTEDRIAFDDISLSELIDKLSRQYDRSIVLVDEDLKNTHFKISLRNHETLEEVLSALKTILSVKVEYQEEHIVISQ